MKLAINLLLFLLIGFLGFMLYNSIKAPISFQTEKKARAAKVKNRLLDIKASQEIYRDIVGKYAHDFDTLKSVLVNDSIEFVKIEQDPEFPDDVDKFLETYSYKSALDSINTLKINLDSLRYVPYSDKEFTIEADTLTYQKTKVNVLQVSTRWKDFMGPFADVKYQKYDNSYDPNKLFKFGDMSKPTLNGNWPE